METLPLVAVAVAMAFRMIEVGFPFGPPLTVSLPEFL